MACLATLVSATVLVLFAPTQQVPQAPFFNPYFNPYDPYFQFGTPNYPNFYPNGNQRLFFQGILPSLLAGQPLVTRTTIITTTITSTTPITCTKNVAACDEKSYAFASLQRSLDVEDQFSPTEAISAEATRVPEVGASNEPYSFVYGPYESYQLASSLRELGPDSSPLALQYARQFGGVTTVTFTVSTTLWSTSTRTIVPACSTAGFFFQCP